MATTLASVVAQLTPPGDSKVSRSLRARRGLLVRLEQHARATRDPSRPLIWFHAPSVGEGLQAHPVVQALRAMHPEWQIAYTFFSPSAAQFATSIGADISDYLPFDRAGNAEALLNALKPSALVFAKLDVWPVLVERASARGIPVAMISGTLAARSGRRGWWSRQLLRDAYATLSAVGAIDVEHADRLVELGVRRSALSATGDTRFDQVSERAAQVDRARPLLRALTSSRLTVVAGSTWPADEAVLLNAWASVGAVTAPDDTIGRPRLIIAPHEPTLAHCVPIEAWARRARLTLGRLSEIERSTSGVVDDADVILVDRVGALGELYALADAAFVGGGFHASGLHSVIEPAAFGVPVLFGPRHDMSREAGLLIAAGGAHSVEDAGDLAGRLRGWIADGAHRKAEGALARAVVQHERGATVRSVRLIEQLLVKRGL